MKKLAIRLAIHFVVMSMSLILFMGFILFSMTEFLLPLFHIQENHVLFNNLILLLSLTSIILFSLYYGIYLSKPMLMILRWIQQLANQQYEEPLAIQKMYQSKNKKLRLPYSLYQDVIASIRQLSINLQKNEIERQSLEKLRRDWVAGVSHDIKTPLTYITGYSSMLLSKDYQWTSEEQSQFVQEIHSKGLHIQELIQDFSFAMQMDHSTIPLKKERIEMVEWLRRIVADLSNIPQAKDQELSFESPHDQLFSMLDTKMMKRALQNIIVNAIVHNPPDTKILIQFQVESQHIMIRITDNGIGMDEETQQQLFERYYRGTSTQTKSDGTGLGMSIAKQLIHAHSGVIHVESTIAKGTSIKITLPVN